MNMIKRLAVIPLCLLLALLPARAQRVDNRLAETWYQYAPALADIGLGLTGVQAEHGILDRSIELGCAYAAELILVNGILKNVIREERPDGSAFNSFPSGHTAFAFTGAELVRKEYGWGWGAGAYAVATCVGVARVCHKRHWWWDTVAGAGCGILCANIGGWLLEPTKRLFGIKETPGVQLSMAPVADPFTGTVCASLSLTF
jgi:membrane-associated phospholipid phosphatase